MLNLGVVGRAQNLRGQKLPSTVFQPVDEILVHTTMVAFLLTLTRSRLSSEGLASLATTAPDFVEGTEAVKDAVSEDLSVLNESSLLCAEKAVSHLPPKSLFSKRFQRCSCNGFAVESTHLSFLSFFSSLSPKSVAMTEFITSCLNRASSSSLEQIVDRSALKRACSSKSQDKSRDCCSATDRFLYFAPRASFSLK